MIFPAQIFSNPEATNITFMVYMFPYYLCSVFGSPTTLLMNTLIFGSWLNCTMSEHALTHQRWTVPCQTLKPLVTKQVSSSCKLNFILYINHTVLDIDWNQWLPGMLDIILVCIHRPWEIRIYSVEFQFLNPQLHRMCIHHFTSVFCHRAVQLN